MKGIPDGSPCDGPAVRVAWPLAAQLGEGPLWRAEQGALWFVDILSRRLHRFDPATGDGTTIDMPGRPSFVVPALGGGMVMGMELALWHVDDAGAPLRELAAIGGDRDCRTNDATVDPRGRLWFGTMDLGERAPTGQVHVYDGATLRVAGGRCPITNGPAISPDGGTLYHVDTLGGRIEAFDIRDRDTLEVGRVFAAIDPADGTPDGVTVDSEGCVWVGLWGGWALRRYSADGELLAVVPIPCANVTKLAFGGADLRTAFVTTARAGLSEDAVREQALAGALFAFAAPAPGLPLPAVAIA
jgi:D-xylonolactonase